MVHTDWTVMIQLTNLQRYYVMASETIKALDGINLNIPAGERVVLLGPSGSWKTTLLNCVAGLDTPTGGTYSFEGNPVTGNSEELTTFRRKNVGYVFQFFNLLQDLNFLKNMSFDFTSKIKINKTKVKKIKVKS